MDHVITLSTASLLFALILHFPVGPPIVFAAPIRNFTNISARMDMVVILSQMPLPYDNYHEAIYAALHGSHLLRIGDGWTKLAIVAGSGEGEFKPRIVMNLTGNGTQFVETLRRWNDDRAEKQEANHVFKLAEAFDLILTEIFSKTTPDLAKVVFFVMTSAPKRHMDTVKAASKLRENGVLIYTMVKEKGKHASDRSVALNYTDNSKRVIVYDHDEYFDDLALAVKLLRYLISNALYTDLCQWSQKCQCNQVKGPCDEIYVLPYLVDPIDEECRRLMPTTRIGNCTPTTTSSSLTPAEIFALTSSAVFFVIQVTVAVSLCTWFR